MITIFAENLELLKEQLFYIILETERAKKEQYSCFL